MSVQSTKIHKNEDIVFVDCIPCDLLSDTAGFVRRGGNFGDVISGGVGLFSFSSASEGGVTLLDSARVWPSTTSFGGGGGGIVLGALTGRLACIRAFSSACRSVGALLVLCGTFGDGLGNWTGTLSILPAGSSELLGVVAGKLGGVFGIDTGRLAFLFPLLLTSFCDGSLGILSASCDIEMLVLSSPRGVDIALPS